MHENDVRLLCIKQGFHASKHAARNVEERLTGSHHMQIIVRYDTEGIQHLLQHLTMLAGNTDQRLKLVRMLFEYLDKRTHFYGFWSRPKDEHDLLSAHLTSTSYSL